MIITKTNINIDDERTALSVSKKSVIQNGLLALFKFTAGLVSNSGAMISDAVHSFSDVFSTLIVIAGIKFANKDSDKEHPYGHERFESVAAIILSIMLAGTGVGIGYVGIDRIFLRTEELEIPGITALIAAVISIAVKEYMYRYTRRAAKKINSGALLADAWHHRSDALSSIGSFIGILGARLGFPILDPIAGIIISCFIIKVSIDIFRDSIAKMTDRACSDDTINEIKNIAENHAGVISVDSVKTRLFGNRIYVEIAIKASGGETLSQINAIVEKIHDSIEEKIPKIKHCNIYVSPDR